MSFNPYASTAGVLKNGMAPGKEIGFKKEEKNRIVGVTPIRPACIMPQYDLFLKRETS
jgi:hypothetical protein